MATPKLRDERLAWLAVRDQLRRAAGRSPLAIVANVLDHLRPGRGLSAAPSGSEVRTNSRMRRYAVAVDLVSTRLNGDERHTLRETGAVPPWFLAAVRAEAQKVRF